MISSTKNEDMSSRIDEKEMQCQGRRQQEASQIFAMHCENFATIAKISQSKRNFRYAQIFDRLAKFLYHSENYCAKRKFEFRYALFFSL